MHAEPPDRVDGGIRLLDADGNGIEERIRLWRDRLAAVPADLLIVGHSHQVYAHRLGDLLLVNPGSTVFNHSAAIIDLDDLAVHFLPLESHAILPSWNFSHAFSRPSPTC